MPRWKASSYALQFYGWDLRLAPPGCAVHFGHIVANLRILTVGLDANPVVDRIPKTLLTAKIHLGRLNGDVTHFQTQLYGFANALFDFVE